MASFPGPPAAAMLRSATTDDDIVAVARHTSLARVYRVGGSHPLQWNEFREHGPIATARFDPHPPVADGVPRRNPSAAVMYTAVHLQTCVAEVFQATRVIDRTSATPYLVVWRPARTLRLLDLTANWPTRAGASQAISSGPRDRARAWARAIRGALPDIDGLWYRSAMDGGSPAICLWAPARSALPARPRSNLPLADPGLALPLGRIAAALGYRLL